MKTIRNILVVVPETLELSPALVRARSLAKQTGAVLDLCLFEYNEALLKVPYADAAQEKDALARYLDERDGELAELAKELEQDGVRVERDVIWGWPLHEELAVRALTSEPDLVIKDVHSESRLKRLFFTPEDWNLLRYCPAPLMLVNPVANANPDRIVVAVDPVRTHHKPAGLDDEVMEAANVIAKSCDSRIDVVHAFEWVPVPSEPRGGGVFVDNAALKAETEHKHRRAFRAFIEEKGVDRDRAHFLEGTPEDVLANYANSSLADLIVMGTVHRKGLERIMLGSTAERVLYKLNCDVLAIKPPGFSDLIRERADREDWTGVSGGTEHLEKMRTFHL